MKPKTKRLGSNILFMAPGSIIYILFMIVPIAMCFYYSLTNWDGIAPTYKFVGLRNFARILEDNSFWDAFQVTIIITGVSTVLQNVFGILFAVWLNTKEKIYGFAKAIMFLPAILSSVVVSFIWSYMTQGDGGILNTILAWFGIAGFDYFATDFITTLTVTFVISWAALGFYITVYDATLKTIPEELYEAARIDGAGYWSQFKHITLPLLMPGMITCVIFSLIAGLRQYDFVRIMTPQTIETISVNAISRMTEYNMFGYSVAIVVVLFLFIIAISVLQRFWFRSREVKY